MIIETSFEQHDPEWYDARIYSVGATGISNIVTSTGKLSGSRENFLIEKASQHLTGRVKPIYPTYEMKWGTEFESEAREHFSFVKDIEVSTCAMIFSDEKRNWHVSPDGTMLEIEEGLEIKCPMLKTHLEYLKKKTFPGAYRLQVQTSLALTGWDVWWFMSYFPGGVKNLILPVRRDEQLITIIKDEIERFLDDLDELVTKLKA